MNVEKIIGETSNKYKSDWNKLVSDYNKVINSHSKLPDDIAINADNAAKVEYIAKARELKRQICTEIEKVINEQENVIKNEKSVEITADNALISVNNKILFVNMISANRPVEYDRSEMFDSYLFDTHKDLSTMRFIKSYITNNYNLQSNDYSDVKALYYAVDKIIMDSDPKAVKLRNLQSIRQQTYNLANNDEVIRIGDKVQILTEIF